MVPWDTVTGLEGRVSQSQVSRKEGTLACSAFHPTYVVTEDQLFPECAVENLIELIGE